MNDKRTAEAKQMLNIMWLRQESQGVVGKSKTLTGSPDSLTLNRMQNTLSDPKHKVKSNLNPYKSDPWPSSKASQRQSKWGQFYI